MAQNTISQLERGERKAMPSTVRKLADALGVDPPVLMAESRINRPIESTFQSGGAQAFWSKLPAEELDLQFRRERKEQERAAADRQRTRQREAPKDRSIELPLPGTLPHLSRELLKEEARVRKEWYETGRWAEYYVSGELSKRARAFVEAQDVATILSREGVEGPLVTLLTNPEGESEGQYLQDIRTALRSYTGDLAAVRSRLTSNDPREILQAAQLVLERARRIVEEHDRYLESFRRIPDRYYARPTACSRMVKLQEALSEQRVAAGEDIQKLMDLYDECLDTLEDQIVGMREEGDVIEEFVRQAQKSEG